MKRISFDFDGTLERKNVFEMAKYLKDKGFELWIVTSRCTEKEYRKLDLFYNNHDVFDMADKLQIPNERIVFTNLKSKSTFFNSTDKEFLIHLDDDPYELLDIMDIKKNIEVINVDYEFWDKSLLEIINENI